MSQNSAALKQMEDYAFNIFGWAMKIPAGLERKAVTILNAYEPSSMPWEKAASSMQDNGEEPWRTSLALTLRERSTSDMEDGVLRYLLVGYTYPGLTADHTKKHILQRKQTSVGARLNCNGVIDTSDPSILPVMVVTQLQPASPDSTVLYALLGCKNGLCTPFHVGQRNCFYLPIFRDGTTDLKSRGPAWNRLVQKQRIRPFDNALLRAKQGEEAENTSKVIMEPTRLLQNKLSSMIKQYCKFHQPWDLQEIKWFLRAAGEELVHQPQGSSDILRKFVDNEETEWDENDAVQMIKVFHDQWQDAKTHEISTADVTTLKFQLVHGGIEVDYRLLRPFLLEAGHVMEASKEAGQQNIDGAAATALATVKRVLGHVEWATPIPTDQVQPVLLALKPALRDMLTAGKQPEEPGKDSTGDQIMTGTSHNILEDPTVAPDTDVANLARFLAARYLTAATLHKHRSIECMVEDVVEALEEMKLR